MVLEKKTLLMYRHLSFKEVVLDMAPFLQEGGFRYKIVMDPLSTIWRSLQGSHRLEKYLNIQDCLEKYI